MNNGYQGKRIEVIAMTMARSGTYAQQWRRPYETLSDGVAIQQLQERFDQVGGQHTSMGEQLFTGIASSFMRPQADPESQIMVPNGWGTEKYYFIMEVRVFNQLGGTNREVIQGYTDFTDMSHGGLFDPRMRFYINSITTLRDVVEVGNFGNVSVPQVSQSFQVIANNNYMGPSDYRDPNSGANVSMRPMDVLGAIQTQALRVTNDIVDTRSGNGRQPKTSKRQHTLPSSYIGTIVSGYARAAQQSMYDMGPEVYANALGNVADRGLTKDEFIRCISGVNNTSLSNSFSWSDLLNLDPQLGNSSDQRVQLIDSAPLTKIGGVMADIRQENFAEWGGSNLETVAATILANSLPALMMTAGLRHLTLNATNFSGMPFVQVPYAATLVEGMPFSPLMFSNLEGRIQAELIDDISANGNIAYRIEADIKLTEFSTITVQLENHAPVTYSFPTFADALMSPVITGDNGRLTNLSGDFDNLMTQLVQVKSPSLEDLTSGGFANI